MTGYCFSNSFGVGESMAVIEIKNLKKNYGKHIGTRDVSFSVDKGELFGFVGPNGAGKSTTIKALLGFIYAQSGSAFVGGIDAFKYSKEIKKFTGYVPSDVRLYENMRISELLQRNSRFYETEEHGHEVETKRLCGLLELDVSKHFHELSTGNKKKVSIICALAPKPDVIIMDEPTNGLDPIVQVKLFAELKKRTADGATVLLSSHNLAEVQEYCDKVAFIKDGKILAVTDLTEIHPQKIVTVIGGNFAPIASSDIIERNTQRDTQHDIPRNTQHDTLRDTQHDIQHDIQREKDKCIFRHSGDGKSLIELLGRINPDEFTVQTESIEERFMSMYSDVSTV
jgi:ABC-2 type transport system ATP-binding protein